MFNFTSTKTIPLGSCAFRQPKARSHCSMLHGYRLIAKFWFEGNELDDNNWVVDFGALKGLKELLENDFDHTTCIDYKDPMIHKFVDLHANKIIDLRVFTQGVGIEKFAERCWYVANEYVQKLTNNRCRVKAVEVFEHELNSAIFEMPTTIQYNVQPVEAVDNTPKVIHGDDFTVAEPEVKTTQVERFEYLNVPKKAKKSKFVITPPPIEMKVDKSFSQPNPVTSQPAPLNCPPLNLAKTTNTFSDPFKGTSWGNSSRRVA